MSVEVTESYLLNSQNQLYASYVLGESADSVSGKMVASGLSLEPSPSSDTGSITGLGNRSSDIFNTSSTVFIGIISSPFWISSGIH